MFSVFFPLALLNRGALLCHALAQEPRVAQHPQAHTMGCGNCRSSGGAEKVRKTHWRFESEELVPNHINTLLPAFQKRFFSSTYFLQVFS